MRAEARVRSLQRACAQLRAVLIRACPARCCRRDEFIAQLESLEDRMKCVAPALWRIHMRLRRLAAPPLRLLTARVLRAQRGAPRAGGGAAALRRPGEQGCAQGGGRRRGTAQPEAGADAGQDRCGAHARRMRASPPRRCAERVPRCLCRPSAASCACRLRLQRLRGARPSPPLPD